MTRQGRGTFKNRYGTSFQQIEQLNGFRKKVEKCKRNGMQKQSLKKWILYHLRLFSTYNYKNDVNYEDRRRYPIEHNGDLCYVCNENRMWTQHHIFLIKNGGLNWELNKIPICYDCHKLIHPWIPPKDVAFIKKNQDIMKEASELRINMSKLKNSFPKL